MLLRSLAINPKTQNLESGYTGFAAEQSVSPKVPPV